MRNAHFLSHHDSATVVSTRADRHFGLNSSHKVTQNMARNIVQNIAVIGGGVAGLGAAWLLSRRHHVSLFEASSAFGGHAHTAFIGPESTAVDTGFIVYNTLNYPNLIALFEHLGVPTAASDMSFGVSLAEAYGDGRLEYAGSDINTLFAQRRNLLRPRFWRMLLDLRRFYRDAPSYLARCDDALTIGELLLEQGYSTAFIDDHLIPMAAAIWSASRDAIRAYPAAAFIRFFANHGLLQLTDRPQWRTVRGGSLEYVRRLLADCELRAVTEAGIVAVRRTGGKAMIIFADGSQETFDAVVLAVHADQALALLRDASADERSILAPFSYSENQVYLHADIAFMPRHRRAWSSWNYIEPQGATPGSPLCVSYWMNRLQPLTTAAELFVTLNPPQAPRPELTYGTYRYAHPQFSAATAAARERLHLIQGAQSTWFCGAWCGHGFHEDGLQAGLWVAEQFGATRPWPNAGLFDRMPSGCQQRLAHAA